MTPSACLYQCKKASGEDLDFRLAGREAEAGLLESMVKRLMALCGGTLILTGTRGSGKTALTNELVEIGQRLGMVVHRLPSKASLRPQSISMARKVSRETHVGTDARLQKFVTRVIAGQQ